MNFKEALIVHLQGEKVEKRSDWMPSGKWVPLIQDSESVTLKQLTDPNFGSACDFRLAPRTIFVNGVEVPSPEKEALEYDTTYYTPNLTSDDLYRDSRWRGDSYDERWLERGLIYLRKEDAISRAKAMLITTET